jgi:rfaE bifunctional protein kinase chain/domain
MDDLLSKFGHKIKTAAEVKKIIGERPRDQVVIMCHGVFDIVHPGHVRHLVYAKSKADILVASITADIHITKGIHRPHVPHKLRAVNIAAFGLVDYVIIDENPTPLENIAYLQPDYFAKGYEYVANGMPTKTSEEAEIVEAYGGEVIFTPGDYVYSSSGFINLAPPELKLEKLSIVLSSEGISFDDLRGVVKKMQGFRVHVVGDLIVDSFTRASMIGGQTKSPTMSVLYEGKTDYVGGAGVVAKHLRAAGADVVFTTVLGNDQLKDFALEDLKASGVECMAIIDQTRPTTNKNAIIVKEYRLLKVDTLDNSTISDHIVAEFVKQIKEVKCDAVIFSDFRHGIFNKRTIPTLAAAIPANAYKVADSQVASRWGNITEFKNFDLITPNEREARFSMADQDSGIRSLAANVYDAAQCKTLMLKLGEKGILTCKNGDHKTLDSFMVLDSFANQVIDPVGSGDALLAYSTLAMLVTKSPAVATILGSIAAACLCEVDGNIPVTPNLVLAKLESIENQMNFVKVKAKSAVQSEDEVCV